MNGATETTVLTLLLQGKNVPAVADVTTWPAAAVRKVAARNGLMINADGIAYRPDTESEHDRARAVEQADLATLLKLAQACPDRLVGEALARHRTATGVLRERLLAYERHAARVRIAEHIRTESQEEIKRLTAQLEQAKHRLKQAAAVLGHGPKTKAAASSRRYRPGVDYQTSEARAWAKAHGCEQLLPRGGPWVPDEVIDAMRAATVPLTTVRAVAEATREVA